MTRATGRMQMPYGKTKEKQLSFEQPIRHSGAGITRVVGTELGGKVRVGDKTCVSHQCINSI